MVTIIRKTLLLLALLSGCAVVSAKDKPVEIFVSPQGNDAGRGTSKSPYQTLERARDAIRGLRAKGKADSATVWLRGGTYWMEQPFVLEPQDSYIVFKACENETPVLSGARQIEGWKPVTGKLTGMSPEAEGKLWVADVQPGWRFHYMFVDGRRAERSKAVHTPWRQWPKDHQFGTDSTDRQVIRFENKAQLANLPSNGDLEMVCIMAQYGVMGNGVVTDIDPEAGTVRWNSKQVGLNDSRDPYERGYCFENALCLIDRPGEWAVDSEHGKVYYWPQEDENLATAQVLAPKLYELVRLQGNEAQNEYVRKVSFEGLTFIYTDRVPENEWPDEWLTRQWENVDAMVYLTGTEACRIYDCRLLHSGSYGVTINHYGQRNIVEKCEIGWTGSGGVFLEGYGPGTLDVSRGNRIVRNYIHDHGLGNYWHSPSVQIYQSGDNYIAYNLLQRSAYNGISMVGVNPETMSEAKCFFPGTYDGLFHVWSQHAIRWQDFSPEIQEGIRKDTFHFDRENVKPYLHTRNNLVEYNIISEPHTKLNEGGAIYAYSVGRGNKWMKNVTFKSSGMPASSIYALDNVVEYTTVKDNVYWIEGPILNGIGARSEERGNVISGNIRVNFKKEFEQRIQRETKGTWYENVEGREPLDRLVKEITDRVEQMGGWPEYADICIPAPGEQITRYGDDLLLPPGAHVTIE